MKLSGMLRLKFACYTSNLSMSIASNLTPLLFISFRSLYGISYARLGLLVLINFLTQLVVDLAFSFFARKFNIPLTVRLMPVLAATGLVLFALAPSLFADCVYLGLALGTVVFSLSCGLGEVLISPIIAALPSKNPDREMSRLHSVYAWGTVGVVILTTVFLLVFKAQNWQWLPILFALVPTLSAILYAGAEIPSIQTPERECGASRLFNRQVILCVLAIFLGGATECTMAQWASGYIERGLGIDKLWGDIGGVAVFAAMLGIGRTLYAKIGKNAARVLWLGAISASACYLLAVFSPFAWLGLVACALTGFCVSMLWPGSLIVMAERIPRADVVIYALMAAGGDLGASFGSQMVGVATDASMTSANLALLAEKSGLSVEQLGMKTGLLVGAVFPILATILYTYMCKSKSDEKTSPHA